MAKIRSNVTSPCNLSFSMLRDGPLMAVSGPKNLVFLMDRGSASPPKADLSLIDYLRSANDPKGTPISSTEIT